MGFFYQVSLDLINGFSANKFDFLMRNIPYNECDLIKFNLNSDSVILKRLDAPNVMLADEKIKLFCEFYKHYRKVQYKATAIDGNKLRSFTITGELLDCYFRSTSFIFHNKWSVSNFCKYYNELCSESAGINKPAIRVVFPDGYSQAFESECTPYERYTYHQYLFNKGWRREKFEGKLIWNLPK